MGRQHHFGAAFEQIVDGGEGFTDAGIVGDRSVFLAARER